MPNPGDVQEAPPRALSIDLWKSVSMFGVVWIHCSFIVAHAPAHLDLLSPLFHFCVPVFLILWAYLAEKSASRSGTSWGKSLRRVGSLLVPFLFWSTLYWLLQGDFQSPIGTQLSRYWSGYGWPGQYFFVVLIQLLVLFPLLRALGPAVSSTTIGAGAMAGFVLVSLVWSPSTLFAKIGDRPFLYWLPYVLYGIGLAREGAVGSRLHLAAIVAVVATIPLEVKWIHGPLSTIGPYLHLTIMFASFCIGSWAVGNAGRKLGMDRRLAWISTTVSRNSLAIFCINPLFVVLSGRWLHLSQPVAFPGAFLLVPLATTILVILGCLLVSRILSKLGLGVLCQN